MPNKQRVLPSGLGAAFVGALLWTSVALGQTTPTAPAASVGVLEEIVVTANKREQNLNDVGASVVAVSADSLSVRRIESGADLARETPGLVYTPTPNNTPVYTLRGVGFYDATLAASPDVSLYIDQVPLPLPVMASLTVFDLERVEVLKGPQGTLFGNNATGGAINFIAAKPTKVFSAGTEIGYSRFNTVDVSGFVSGPLSDTMQARVAVKAANGDGWQRNLAGTDTLGKRDNAAIRLLVDWQPSDALRFALNLNAWRDQNDPQGSQVQRLDIKNPAGSVGLGGTVPADWPVLSLQPVPEGNSRIADWSAGIYRPYTDNRFWQGTLRIDYDISGNVSLTSLTSYSHLAFLNGADQDGTALVLFQNYNRNGKIDFWGQEIRLSNGAATHFRWVVGANYGHTDTGEYADQPSFDSSSAPVNGAGLVRDDNYQQMRDLAGFGNIEYDLTQNLTWKAGIRESRAKRDSSASGFTLPGVPPPAGLPYTFTEFFNIVYPLIYGPGVVPTIQEGQSFVLDTRLNPDGTPVDPATFMKTGPFVGQLDEKSTSWSTGLNYKVADNLLLWANVSKGFKSGSFPILAAAIFEGLEPVTQESLLDYDIGFKSQLLDNKLSVNGTVFYYDYKDKQLLTKFIDPIFGALDKLQNVPKSSVVGAELEVSARPIDGWTLTGAISYLDAKVDEYIGVVGSVTLPNGLRGPILADFKGAKLPFAAPWQYSFRSDYEFGLSASLNGLFGVGVTGQSNSFSNLSITPLDKQDYEIGGYSLLSLSAGVESSDQHWRLRLWGTNVLNKYVVTNRFLNYDTLTRTTGRPAEYGITYSYGF